MLDNIQSLNFFASELILIVGTIGLLVVSLLKRVDKNLWALGLAAGTLLFALIAVVNTHFEASTGLFGGMIVLDSFGQFFKVLIIASALVALVLSSSSRDLVSVPKPEFYAFLVSLTLGLNVMTVSNNLLMMYLAIEMASIISYVMAGYLAEGARSEESGLKYVLYGGVASGIMIFGMSLLYGLSGSLDLVQIREYFLHQPTDRVALFITFIFVLAGLGYKMAIAPFHMWSPDVYEGAPMPVTAFLSVASKAAGFAVSLRFFYVAFLVVEGDKIEVLKSLDWQTLIGALAVITMTVGNVIALQQTNVKRFLAYSSVAHAGYMLMGIAAQSVQGIESIAYYFMVYFLMNLGAFVVVSIIANQFDTESMEDYKGLLQQNSFGAFLAVTFGVFLFSLAGLPPFSGFLGKWYVFKAAINAELVWVAAFGAINSVISLYYYVRLAKFMMIDGPIKTMKPVHDHWRMSSLVAVFAFFTVVFGIYFEPLARWAQSSAVLFR